MNVFKRVCGKCKEEFETLQKKETPLCHACQHDKDELEDMERAAEEIERQDRWFVIDNESPE